MLLRIDEFGGLFSYLQKRIDFIKKNFYYWHGDINGDGFQDMIIGAPGKFGTGKREEVYVVYGSSRFRPTKEFDLSTTLADITMYGKNIADRSGISVASGDVNGDGLYDMIAGAKYADPSGN